VKKNKNFYGWINVRILRLLAINKISKKNFTGIDFVYVLEYSFTKFCLYA